MDENELRIEREVISREEQDNLLMRTEGILDYKRAFKGIDKNTENEQ